MKIQVLTFDFTAHPYLLSLLWNAVCNTFSFILGAGPELSNALHLHVLHQSTFHKAIRSSTLLHSLFAILEGGKNKEEGRDSH